MTENTLLFIANSYCIFVQKNSWISAKSIGGLFWAETHPPTKFCRNPCSSFYVILLTNQRTNRHR